MKQFTAIAGTFDYLKSLKDQGLTIGFVPTMGALHEGHLALVRRSTSENDLTVSSIFVNPIQFNNPEDLVKYPRTLSKDLSLLEDARCDIVFTPAADEMYPGGEPGTLSHDFGMLDQVMEGKFRPGHFNGVAVVVKKLFEIVQPTRAYFGKKDFQQLVVIRHMVEKLELPVEIIPCETVREPDGLAMSSRNTRLTKEQRAIAPVIFQVLLEVRKNAGKVPVDTLKQWAIKKMEEMPGFQIEYFEIGGAENLMPVEQWHQTDYPMAFVAVFLGDVRLIDNIELFS